jgi:selT/selW/selH-like putative selenoprotein
LDVIEVVPSDGGRFEIALDGEPVFSKIALGRHAEPGEVVSLVRKILGEGS